MQTFLFHANVVGSLAARRAGVPHVVTGIRVAERRRRLAPAAGALGRPLGRSPRVREPSRCATSRRPSGRLPSDKLLVIPNGVDLARLRTRRARADRVAVAAGCAAGIDSG